MHIATAEFKYRREETEFKHFYAAVDWCKYEASKPGFIRAYVDGAGRRLFAINGEENKGVCRGARICDTRPNTISPDSSHVQIGRYTSYKEWSMAHD